jgi:hypothetical protein
MGAGVATGLATGRTAKHHRGSCSVEESDTNHGDQPADQGELDATIAQEDFFRFFAAAFG